MFIHIFIAIFNKMLPQVRNLCNRLVDDVDVCYCSWLISINYAIAVIRWRIVPMVCHKGTVWTLKLRLKKNKISETEIKIIWKLKVKLILFLKRKNHWSYVTVTTVWPVPDSPSVRLSVCPTHSSTVSKSKRTLHFYFLEDGQPEDS